MIAFIRHTHQVEITAQKTVDIIVWAIVMLAFIRHTHQVGITAQKTVDIIVWAIVMLAFIRHTLQVGITAQKTVDIIVWVIVMLAFIRHTHQVEITVLKTWSSSTIPSLLPPNTTIKSLIATALCPWRGLGHGPVVSVTLFYFNMGAAIMCFSKNRLKL